MWKGEVMDGGGVMAEKDKSRLKRSKGINIAISLLRNRGVLLGSSLHCILQSIMQGMHLLGGKGAINHLTWSAG